MSQPSEQILAEIREANLSYLMLAQNLIRADRAEALFRLAQPSPDHAHCLGQHAAVPLPHG
jgi:hypothetical protein